MPQLGFAEWLRDNGDGDFVLKDDNVRQVTLELIRDLNCWRERAAETRAKVDSYRASSE